MPSAQPSQPTPLPVTRQIEAPVAQRSQGSAQAATADRLWHPLDKFNTLRCILLSVVSST